MNGLRLNSLGVPLRVAFAAVTALCFWRVVGDRRPPDSRTASILCDARLHRIYQAFAQYQKDYGRYPDNPVDLIPNYLDRRAFVCPGMRVMRFTVPQVIKISNGRLTILDTDYFPYLCLKTSGAVYDPARVPLVQCRIHGQLLYETAGREVHSTSEFAERYGIPSSKLLMPDGKIEEFSDFDQPSGSQGLLDFRPGDWTKRERLRSSGSR